MFIVTAKFRKDSVTFNVETHDAKEALSMARKEAARIFSTTSNPAAVSVSIRPAGKK